MATSQASKSTLAPEEFMQRAVRIFDVESAQAWTRFERAVFNLLVGEMIYRHGYAGISDDMLQDAKQEMERLVRSQFRGATASPVRGAAAIR